MVDGWMPPLPPEVFGVGPDQPELQALLEQKLQPHPTRTWTDPIRLPASFRPEDFQPVYVHATSPALSPSSFPFHYARLSRRREWRTATLATGHDLMLTRPEDVACVIQSAAQSGASLRRCLP